MAKRGRPKKHGVQPSWMLVRRMEVLYEYDQARQAGEKHASAVCSAVAAVRKRHPRMPLSQTEAKRILADWRRRNCRTGVLITKPEPPDDVLTLPDGRKARKLLIFGYGLLPRYPRHNARKK